MGLQPSAHRLSRGVWAACVRSYRCAARPVTTASQVGCSGSQMTCTWHNLGVMPSLLNGHSRSLTGCRDKC